MGSPSALIPVRTSSLLKTTMVMESVAIMEMGYILFLLTVLKLHLVETLVLVNQKPSRSVLALLLLLPLLVLPLLRHPLLFLLTKLLPLILLKNLLPLILLTRLRLSSLLTNLQLPFLPPHPPPPHPPLPVVTSMILVKRKLIVVTNLTRNAKRIRNAKNKC